MIIQNGPSQVIGLSLKQIQDLSLVFIRKRARLPADRYGIALEARDQVHMEMEYSLSCGFAVILDQIEAVRVKTFIEFCSDSLRNCSGAAKHVRGNLEQIGVMVLRKD